MARRDEGENCSYRLFSNLFKPDMVCTYAYTQAHPQEIQKSEKHLKLSNKKDDIIPVTTHTRIHKEVFISARKLSSYIPHGLIRYVLGNDHIIVPWVKIY